MIETGRSLIATFNPYGSLARPDAISKKRWKVITRAVAATTSIKAPYLRLSLPTGDGEFLIYEAVRRERERPGWAYRKPDPVYDVYLIEIAKPTEAAS